jgi:3-oxoadipate enol-lactonase
MPSQERSGAIEIEGRQLAWRAHGSGSPLLLINGYASTGVDWDPSFVAALAERHEVICPDNRGLGGSELGSGGFSVADMAADMEALLDALAVERAIVVGWSMGGFVAQALARRAPRRVESLALLATDPGTGAVDAEPEIWARLTDRSGTAREQASRLIPLLFPALLAPLIDEQFGQLIAAARAAMSPAALDAQEAAMRGWHEDGAQVPVGSSGGASAQETQGPPMPVVVVHGREDVVIPAANAERLAARWPGARVELVEGAAHAVMAQEPARVAAAIAAS